LGRHPLFDAFLSFPHFYLLKMWKTAELKSLYVSFYVNFAQNEAINITRSKERHKKNQNIFRFWHILP